MKITTITFIIFCFAFANAQKQDYQWLFGFGNAYVSVNDTLYGGRTLDFNYSPTQVFTHIRQAGFYEDNVSYCDGNGTVVMYSNGTDIYDSRDSIMENGDSINYGWFWNYWITSPSARYEGWPIPQGMIALPSPGDSNQIYLLHYSIKQAIFPDGETYVSDTNYYSFIDLKENNSYGVVTKKNKITTQDSLSDGMLSAVQHGNGRDWWVIHPYYQGNCYYELLLTDTGVGIYNIQCIGPDLVWYGALGSSCFSPDGSKYFWVNALDGIRMFDFDRCNGVLSNPQIIPFPIVGFGDSVTLVAGIAVSPNNRFLYVTANKLVLQYDLLAGNIGASVDTVAVWNGFEDPKPFPGTFFLAQNAPDGKIYINSPNSCRSLHVINRPDEKGDSCLFVIGGVELGSVNNFSLPNFPNYRLGRLPGSACDTIYTETNEVKIETREKILKVFPNPATDIVTVDYGFTNWSAQGVISLEIVSELGQPIYNQTVPQYSGYQKIDVSKYATGIYTAYVKRNEQVVATQKFAKE